MAQFQSYAFWHYPYNSSAYICGSLDISRLYDMLLERAFQLPCHGWPLCLRAPRTEPLINEQLALHFWEKSFKTLVTLDDPCSEVSMSLKAVLFEDLTYILEGDMWRNWQKGQDCNSCGSHAWLIRECCRSSWGFVLAWPPNKTLLPDWQCIMHWARPGEVNICQMIGDQREGHFNHSSNQCCIRLYT